MILQYKGYNDSWVYEDAEKIVVSTVEISIAHITEENAEKQLEEIRKISEQIEGEIIADTSCTNITYLTEPPLWRCGCVSVVMLSDKGKERTYVFDMDKEVYLLSNDGKTVRKV